MPAIDVGRDQVARLMRAAGIRGASRAKKRFTTQADPDSGAGTGPGEPELHRQPPRPAWVCDFTYCSTWSGSSTSRSCRCLLPADRRLEGGPIHDRGPGPRRAEHGRLDAPRHRSRRTHLSLGRGVAIHVHCLHRAPRRHRRRTLDRHRRRRFDNAMAESVIALFKTELHRNPAVLAGIGGPWKGLDDLEVATCGWVSWFNTDASTASSAT